MGAKHFLKGATFGALIASLITILLVPQGGKRTRKDVVKFISTFAKRLTAQAGELKKLSKGAYEELVTRTLEDYTKGKGVASSYYDDIAEILKKNWKEISAVVNKK